MPNIKIKRVYNNNVCLCANEKGQEIVATGKGIAFGKHPDDEIALECIEKTFCLQTETLENDETRMRFEKLVDAIDTNYLNLASEIVEMIRQTSCFDVNDELFLSLADHISLSLEREKMGVPCENPLLYEIQRYYKKEWSLSETAAEIIKQETNIEISEAEKGFITLHIVNATMHERADHLVISVQIVKDILDIVCRTFNVVLEENSLSYERFLRHLQFFAQRVITNSDEHIEAPGIDLNKKHYKKEFACVEEIASYIYEKYHFCVTDAEKSYLVCHLVNVLSSAKK